MAPERTIYNDGNGYFLTLRIAGWVDLFTRRKYAGLIFDSLKYCITHKNLELYHYCLMSNHLHLIASSPDNLNIIIRDFKSYTAHQLSKSIFESDESRKEWIEMVFRYNAKKYRGRALNIWHPSNYPTVLYSPKVIQQKIDYVLQNPVKAGIVSCPEHYLYCSAHPQHPLKGYLKEMQ